MHSQTLTQTKRKTAGGGLEVQALNRVSVESKIYLKYVKSQLEIRLLATHFQQIGDFTQKQTPTSNLISTLRDLANGHFQGGIQRRKIEFQDALLSNSLYYTAQTQTDKSIIVSLSCLGNLKKWFSLRRFQLLADEQTPSLNAIFNIGMQCFVCECAKIC